jgi:hypothetical protein
MINKADRRKAVGKWDGNRYKIGGSSPKRSTMAFIKDHLQLDEEAILDKEVEEQLEAEALAAKFTFQNIDRSERRKVIKRELKHRKLQIKEELRAAKEAQEKHNAEVREFTSFLESI